MEADSNNGGNSSMALDDLFLYEDLAFSSPCPDRSRSDDNSHENGWITSAARAPFAFCDDKGSSREVILNVEFFGEPTWSNILLYVHGVCESAETWTVQNLAKICFNRKWRMAVLELEGHGLSGGARGVMGKDWDRCIRQVKAFCKHALTVDQAQKQAQTTARSSPKKSTNFVLAGASLGGALAVYVSQAISNDKAFSTRESFLGTLLLCPAVGVDPSVVPPPFIVSALTVLSWIAPTAGINGATPTEDPLHYSCPPWTQRNFKGAWPLITSKMLLDVTSKRIPQDVECGSLNLLQRDGYLNATTTRHAIVVISGEKDPVVPMKTVRSFVNGMKEKAQRDFEAQGTGHDCVSIEMIEIKKGDHGLLAQSVGDVEITATKRKATQITIEQVNIFLKRCEEMITIK